MQPFQAFVSHELIRRSRAYMPDSHSCAPFHFISPLVEQEKMPRLVRLNRGAAAGAAAPAAPAQAAAWYPSPQHPVHQKHCDAQPYRMSSKYIYNAYVIPGRAHEDGAAKGGNGAGK